MKLARFIEESDRPEGLTWKSTIEKLHKDCKPFLKEWAKPQKSHEIEFLFRGTSNRTGGLVKKTVRRDRKPSDMHQMVTDDLNIAFVKKFGWSPRKEGLFVTGSSSQASMYGSTHIVFPIRRYKYLWSGEYNDLYTKLGQMIPGSGNVNKHTNPEDENPMIAAIAKDMSPHTKLPSIIQKKFDKEYGEGSNKGNWVFLEYNDKGVLKNRHKIPIKYNSDIGKWLKLNGFENYTSDNGRLIWEPAEDYGAYYDENREMMMNQLKADFWSKAEAKYQILINAVVNAYTDKHLLNGISRGHEIMMAVKEYYMIINDLPTRRFLDMWFRTFGDTMPKESDAERWAIGMADNGLGTGGRWIHGRIGWAGR